MIILFGLQMIMSKFIKRNNLFLSILFFFFSFSSLKAEYFNYTPDLINAYQCLMNLDFENANQLLERSKKNDPSNGINILIKHYADILIVITSQERKKYNELLENERIILDNIKKKYPKNSPYYLFVQAEIKFQCNIVKLLFNDQVSAIFGMRQAYLLLEENKNRFPNFISNKKTLGFFKVMMGSVPEQYRWIIKFLGLSPDLQGGINFLDEVIKNDSLYNQESNMLKAYLHAFILHDAQKGFDIFSQTKKQFLLNKIVMAWIGLKAGKSKEVYTLLNENAMNEIKNKIIFIHYLKGSSALQYGRFAEVESSLYCYIKNTKSTHYIKDCYYKIFLSRWFLHHKNIDFLLEKIKTEGTTNSAPDKYAYDFAHYEQLPNQSITRSRILSDGGQYQDALKALYDVEVKTLNQKDKTEFYYRQGRIYHLLQEYDKALISYQNALNISGNLPYYFAPNAALQMGIIYYEKNNLEQSKNYLQKTIQYKQHEYKESLDSKARYYLTMIEKKKRENK